MKNFAHFNKVILFFFLLIIVFPSSSFSQDLSKSSREEFNEFIMNHPFMVREKLTKEEIKKIPKRDRPDLAWEQDFLTTLDPSTGKPEKARLFPTLDVIDQMKSALTPAVPGSSTSSAWVERGPNNVAGRTRALVWDPNDATGKKVWAGGVTGGLWYNNDITSTSSQWQSVNDFWDNIAITCIAFDPNNTQIMYVGTGEGFGASASRGAGIWKSTNAGSSWSRLTSTTNFYYVNDLVVRNESNSSVVYAAVDGNFYNGAWHGAAAAGLQRSTNGGSTWSQELPNIPNETVNFVASDIEIGANNRLWVGTRRTPYGATDRGGGYILYSDNGTTWTTAYSATVSNGDGRVELACAPSNANYVYALIENQNQVHEIKKTTNGGSSWTSLSEPNDDDLGIPSTDFSRGQAWYDLIAAVDPNDPNKVIVGAINAHMSTNGGTSWSQISKWSNNPNMGNQPYSYIHADHHNIVFKPGSSTEVIIGTDGGVSWTNNLTNAATSAVFQDRNNGYNVTQFYAGGLNPLAGNNIMVAGAQDNGTQRYSSTGVNSTTEISGGDGAYCFIDQTDGIGVVTSYVYNNYYYHNNSGANYVRKILDNSDAGMFINPADLDDFNNILYTSLRAGEIYKLSNYNLSSYSLDSISITGLSGMPTAIKVSPFSNSANVFVGDVSGNLVKINNANGSNPTFTNLTATAFPNGTISSIEFGTSESEIIVTFKNYGVTSVYYSSNGGTTWASKEGNLPDMPVRWALINPNNTDEVILATEVGVWATTNFSATSPSWAPSNSGLANVRVDMLQHRASNNTVMAITHGRGVFTSNAWNTSSTSQLPIRNISEIKGVDANGVPDSLNYACKIRGIVTSIDFDGNAGYNFFVQDSTGGIYIYSPTDLNSYQVSIGDDIRLIGDIQQFNGLTEFVPDSIAFISSNNQVPSPQWLYSIDESSEGNLIQLNYCQLLNPSAWPTAAGSHNVDILTSNGDTVIMRLDFDANLIPGIPAPTGYFSVVGCQSQFDNSLPYFSDRQVFPRFISDVIPAVNVTFRVDMNNETVSSNGVHLAGNFGNGNPNLTSWNPSGIQLFDSSGTGVYETVLNLTQGYYEYKFINGNNWGFDEVITGCNSPGSTNRFALLTSDTAMPAFCYESCSICPQGDTLYSFDFASGIPAGWSNSGSSTNALWEYRGPNTSPNNNIGSRGAFAGLNGPIQSTSSSNGFMIFDSDYLDDPFGAGGTGSAPAPHVGSLVTNVLDFTGKPEVIVQLESFFRTFESGVGLAFSYNGGTSFPDTTYIHTNLAVNQSTGNAETVRLDISSFVGNKSNVKVAFIFDGRNPLGLNGGQLQRAYYFWMIDDIKFLVKPNNDLALLNANFQVGSYTARYAKMPEGLVPPVSFFGTISNDGAATQPNSKITFSSGNLSYATSGLSLAPDSLANLNSQAPFYALQTGVYNFTATASSDSTDQFQFNNDRFFGFEVTDSTYNLSSGFNNESLGTNSWANASDTFIVANLLELQDSIYINSVVVNITGNSTPGGKIKIQVWDATNQAFGGGSQFGTPLAPTSALYTLTSGDITNGSVKLPILGTGNAKKLTPGSYYVGAALFGNNNADTVRVESDITIAQELVASIIYIPFSAGFGGVYSNGNAFDLAINVQPINPNTLPPLPTANGDTLYSYDFNAGLPTNWLNQGDTTTALWEYRGPNTTPSNATGSRGAYNGIRGPIASATTSNGFMIFDSDYLDDPSGASGTGVSPAPHVGALYTEALNFANQQNLILQFESYFRVFESAAGIAFSTDGGLTYPDTVYVHDNLIINGQTANAETVRLDVSSYIGGQPNVKVAFVFDGRNPLGINGGQFQRGYYFWMIDDIAFLKKPQNDLLAFDVHVKQPNTVGEHQAIPLFLFNPWIMNGKVINKGSSQATNVSLYCQTESGSNTFIPNFVSNPQSVLNAGDTSNNFPFANFGFNNLDNYYLTFYPTSDSTDNFTEGDTIYTNVEVTNNEYRLHRNVWSSAFGTNFNINLGSSDSLVLVNEYYFNNPAQLNQITVDIGFISRVGGEVIPVVYQGNLGAGFTEVYRGTPYSLTATDTSNFNAFIPANFVIDTGLYYVGVMLNSNSNANNVSIIDDQSFTQHPDASIIRLGGNWYNNGNAFHIILNLSTPQVLAQIDLPITWDDTATVNYDIADFDGTFSSIVADPLNSSNPVLKTDKSPTGQPWQGTVLGNSGLANAIPFAQGSTIMSAMVYSPDSGIAVRLKVEDSNNGQISVETEATTTVANAWETLTFDFANQVSGTAAINFTNTYDKVVIFYDFFNNPSTTKSYYVDSVYFGGTPPVQNYNVTFQVDMQNVTAGFTTPELNGTFNNWCGNCNAMTDANNDNIWEVTVQLNAGSIEYKFSADAWSIQEQLSPGLSCVITTGGFTNRSFAVTGDTTLPVVCWETCQACIPNCPQISLSATQTLVSCFGGNDGSLTAYASGGAAPYTYDWGFAQGQTITGLASNSYQVIVTDSNGCADTAFFTLNQPTGPITSQANGALPILEVNNANGTSYLMDFGFMDTATWATNLNLSSASGQLVVARDSSSADSLACASGLANASAINGNIAVVYRGACEFGLKALRCQQAGATGVIIVNNSNVNVNPAGGAFGQQINIPVLLVTQNNGQVLRNLIKNGGSVYMGADTNAPVEPLCNGNQNGSIELNVNGGTSPYAYQWSNNQGSREITGIGAGNYSYTITDANGCVYNNTTSLSEPQALQVGLGLAQNPTSAQANNGSISVNVSGGTMPYSYSWNSIPAQSTDSAINLGVGNYTVTVTDNNLCSNTLSYSLCANDTASSVIEICQGDTAIIFGNPQTSSGNYYQTFTSNAGCDSVIEVSLIVNNSPIIGGVNVTQVTGCGTNDGSISLQGFGAGTITYSLNTGQTQAGSGVFVNLFPASYVVTVTDTNGCSNNTASLVINPFAGSPSQPTINGASTFNYCQGDNILPVSASGGTGTLYWYDDAALANPIDSGSTFTPPSNLGFNIYYVAESANNCQSPPAQIFVEINSVPNAPVLSGGATYCDTEPILPLFAQGVGVTWYADSALSLIIGQGNQLNIGTFANVGVNTVFATSTSNGCEGQPSGITVTVFASPQAPTAPSVAYCNNDSPIALSANLASGNTARWYSDSALNNLVSVNQSFFPSTTVGINTFYLTQFDGQCESQGVSVNSTVYQSPTITSVIANDVTSCGLTDGSISVSAQFSNIGSKYSIDNGLTYQSTGSFNNLSAAGYIVHVADTFCSATYGIATINAPGQPQAPTVIGNDTICSGDSFTGFSALAQGSGILNWYSSPLLGSANLVDTGMVYTPQSVSVGANTYYVTELVGNCEGAAGSVTILVNPLPNVSAGIDQAICDGSSATLVATGASTYSWVGLASNDSVIVSPTALTQYTVIGTSAQGCVNSDSVMVSINPLPTVAAGVMPSLCIDNGNFILPKATPNGGQYSGQNIINNTLLVSQAGVGTHPVYYTYTDNNGCTGIDTTAITVNTLPNVSLSTQSNICANANPVALTGGLPSGGNYSGNGIANGNFDPSAVAGPGVYNVFYSFTDANGCFAADTNTITVDTVPVISWDPFPIICANDAKYTLVEASPSGGIYSGNGVGGSSFDPIAAGGGGAYAISYEFTDGNGCTSTGSQTLNVGVLPIVNLGKDTLLCNNRPTVTLDAGSGSGYEWFLDGISIGATSQTITADSSTSGTYSVIVTNADGCTGSDTVVVSYESICLGVTILSQIDAEVNIFPNPNSGKFVLEVSGNKANNLEVEIYSASGQMVYYNAYEQLSFTREEVDLGNLAGGVYFLTLKTEKGASKYKLIVN